MAQTGLILVIGATGYIGGRLAPVLIEKGYQVRYLGATPLVCTGAPGLEKPTWYKAKFCILKHSQKRCGVWMLPIIWCIA